MAIYTKICPICGHFFKSRRMNTVFCSERNNRCRNKARSFPPEKLKNLIEVANRSMTVTPSVPKVVRDFMRMYGEDFANNSVNTPPVTHRINVPEDQVRLEKEMDMFGISKDETDILLQEAEKIKRNQEQKTFGQEQQENKE